MWCPSASPTKVFCSVVAILLDLWGCRPDTGVCEIHLRQPFTDRMPAQMQEENLLQILPQISLWFLMWVVFHFWLELVSFLNIGTDLVLLWCPVSCRFARTKPSEARAWQVFFFCLVFWLLLCSRKTRCCFGREKVRLLQRVTSKLHLSFLSPKAAEYDVVSNDAENYHAHR